MTLQETIVIRKAGVDTLRITIPYKYAKNVGLQEGDVAVWTSENGDVRLRFTKVTERIESTELTAA
jgi:hypothetical protein